MVPMLDMDSGNQVIDREEYTFADNEINEEESEQSESEDEALGDIWVPSSEDFEQRVLHATDFNFELAAHLIPVLYTTFQGEESSVLGRWETSYRTRAGRLHDQSAGICGGIHFSGGDQSRAPPSRKRRKGNETEDDDTQNGQGNGDELSDNPDQNIANESFLLACPFYKRDPSKYNGSSYRTSEVRKGEYAKCDSGFLKFKDLR